MPSIKKALARKAVRSTARHTAHGTAAKLKREPLRAATLLVFGGLLGALAGWLLTRGSAAPAATAG
jgi:F0F1-type ATP synthase assembly protein I